MRDDVLCDGSPGQRCRLDAALIKTADLQKFNEEGQLPEHRGQTVEIRCKNTNKSAGATDKEFVALPQNALILTWAPKSITYRDGRE